MKRTPMPARHRRLGKQALVSEPIVTAIAFLGIILVAVFFIILLNAFKERPEQEILSERLSLSTDSALLTFLKSPAGFGSSTAFAGGGGAAKLQEGLTVADLIILAQYDDKHLVTVETKADALFDRQFQEFWSLDIDYASTSSSESYGNSYFFDKVSIYAQSATKAAFSSSRIFIPPMDEKATAIVYLTGVDHGPIKVTLESWLLYSPDPY